MDCPYCRRQIEENSLFCGFCGKLLPTGGSQLPLPPPPMDSFQLPPPPPPMGTDSWTQGMSTDAEEHLLGGFTSGNLVPMGIGTGLTSGYGLYATNKRIIGVKSIKGIFSGGLFGIAGLVVGRTDHSAKAIMELENKKDIELRKEDISKIEMKKAPSMFSRPGYLNIVLNSGRNIKFIIRQNGEFQPLRDLMTAFFPEVLRVEQ